MPFMACLLPLGDSPLAAAGMTSLIAPMQCSAGMSLRPSRTAGLKSRLQSDCTQTLQAWSLMSVPDGERLLQFIHGKHW